MKLYRFLLLLILIGAPVIVSAQELSTVNVSALSDAQIQQIVNEVSSRGLSMQDAAALARTRGATEAQIQEVLRRVQELNAQKGGSIQQPAANAVQKTTVERQVFSQKAAVSASPSEKKIFGYYLFNNKNLTFEPSINIQTPKQYVIGIGDEIIINVWGASEATYQLVVDKNGAIQIPKIGPVFINGYTFDGAERVIKKRLTRIYAGMSGRSPNTYASITLGGLKSMRITLVGEVNVPGTYTLPATATLFNALYLSGGPSQSGSFRNIALIRGGKIIKHIDVYDFLVDADPSDNIALQDQDVIYIPTFSKRVSIGGPFTRTGLFEMKGKETMTDLLRFVGGFTENAYKFRVHVVRYTPTEKKVLDIDRANFSDFVLNNGDAVTCGTILDRFENRISINGAVFRPGSYELTDGMTLRSLIFKAEGLREEVYLNRGLITRLKDDKTTEVIPFDVAEVVAGRKDYPLKKDDNVTIKTIFDMREGYNVGIYGLVQNPQVFPYAENMTLKDLIFKAGGFKESADISFIEVARRLSYDEAAQITDSLVHIFTFKIPRDLILDPADANFLLQPYDRVYVRQLPGYRDQGSATITGEVKYAGPYPIKSKKDRLSDLVKRAGGLTPEAYLDAARLSRAGVGIVDIDLRNILNNPGTRRDLLLIPGDNLMIPTEPQTVSISGEVQNPFATTYIPGKSLKYYINVSGGWGMDPFKRRVYVTYPDGSADRTRNFIFHYYPKVLPGSTIFVPKKPQKQKQDKTAQWLAVASTTSSITVAIVAIVNMLKK